MSSSDSSAQSKRARAVFGHTHFANPDSDFLKNRRYATWCLTAELASKAAPFHLHLQGLRLPCGITSLQLFYWTQLHLGSFLPWWATPVFLSSLHVISLTFPSEAYDKSNWPSSHSSKKEFSISKDWFPPLLLQSWTHQKSPCLGLAFFFFF